MSKGIFDPALSDLTGKELAFWGPESFQDYLARNNLPQVRTPDYISIDSLDRLHPSLRENDVMVLRLGMSEGKGAQFGLAKIQKRLTDFFLIDFEVLKDSKGHTFIPTSSYYTLYPFHLIPSSSETSLVNFAFASGLIHHALDMERKQEISIPATGSTTYSFTVRPHSSLEQKIAHNKGQVQVDAIFLGQRDGKQMIFVLEAKVSKKFESLAKHKLVYPILGIAANIPIDMSIIPIYMKVLHDKDGLHFFVVECSFPDPRKRLAGIDELNVVKCHHLIIPQQIW
jgi:hypothetical protein